MRPEMWRAMASSAVETPPHLVSALPPPPWTAREQGLLCFGDPCTDAAMDDTIIEDNPSFNPATKCNCYTSIQNTPVCHITKL